VKSVVNQLLETNIHDLVTKKFAIFLTAPDSNNLMNPLIKDWHPCRTKCGKSRKLKSFSN